MTPKARTKKAKNKRKITILAKPNSKIEKIQQTTKDNYEIWTKEPAKENKANKKTIKILAKHLNIAPSQIEILSGLHSKRKTFQINT